MVQSGKELEDCTATLGKWMGAVSDIDNIHKNSNNPSTFDKLFNGSIQEVAMESFAAKKKVQKQREELKNWLDRTLWSYKHGRNFFVKKDGYARLDRKQFMLKQNNNV